MLSSRHMEAFSLFINGESRTFPGPMSVAGLITSGMTHVVPTLEMKTSFLRPAMPGGLRALGRVLKWGRTICFTEGELYDGQGRLLAKATGTAIPTPFASFKK